MKFIYLSIFLLVSAVHASDFGEILTKQVELKRTTYLTLDLAPDLGTLLEFPLPKEEIENFGIEQINSRFFTNTSIADLTEQDNAFSLFLNSVAYAQALAKRPNAVILSDIFIRYGQYKIVIRARATNKPSKHISHVLFKLGNKDQRTYTQRKIAEVKKKMKAQLESERKKNQAEIKAKITQVIADEFMNGVKFISLDEGAENDYIYINIDEVIQSKNYSIYMYKAYNLHNTKITINQINLKTKKKIKTTAMTPVTIFYDKKIKGSFVIEGRYTDRQTVEIQTSEGVVNVKL